MNMVEEMPETSDSAVIEAGAVREQAAIAEAFGVTYQAVQKSERSALWKVQLMAIVEGMGDP